MRNSLKIVSGPQRPLCGAVLMFLALIAAGCAKTRGPELIVNSHIEYNKAVSQVLKEELLLNIVRRRYMEAPQFLNVSSISSSFKTSTSLGMGVSADEVSDSPVVGTSVDGSVAFSDSPTITITPRQGEDIASQLHGPLSPSIVADLVSTGYPIGDVFTFLVEGINSLRGPDLRLNRFRAGSEEWSEAIMLMEKLSSEGSLVVDRFRWNDSYNDYAYPAESITPEMWITALSTGAHRWKSYDGGKTFFFTSHEMAPAISLDDAARQSPDGQRLMALLNVQPESRRKIWPMWPARVVGGAERADQPDTPRSSLKLRMRSLYNILNMFSYGVRVPPEHELNGRATNLSVFRDAVARGQIDDYSNLLSIQYSEDVPETPFLAVQYRGLWFYIDDQAMDAKAGFNAMYDLWQLSIKTPGTQSQPVTTIQVN